MFGPASFQIGFQQSSHADVAFLVSLLVQQATQDFPLIRQSSYGYDTLSHSSRFCFSCKQTSHSSNSDMDRFCPQVDFNTDTWKELILQKGFRKSEPTVWLFEGLIMYLTPAGVTNLVETVAEVRPWSCTNFLERYWTLLCF